MASGGRQSQYLAQGVKAIALFEIVGGIGGAAFVVWILYRSPFDLSGVILAPVLIAIDILSLAGGLALWQGRPFGRTASIIVQTIQLPKIVSPAVIFLFSFGFDAWVHILVGDDFVHFGFDERFLVSNQLMFYVPSAPMEFGVSLTAWIYLVMLLKYKPQSGPNQEIPPPPTSELGAQV